MRTCSHDKYEIYVLLKLGIRFVKPGRMAVYEVQCTVTPYDDVYIDAIEKLPTCMYARVFSVRNTYLSGCVGGKKQQKKHHKKHHTKKKQPTSPVDLLSLFV